MSNEDLAKTIAALRRVTDEACVSKEKALALLVRVGIYTPDGKLAPQYRAEK